MLAFGDIAERCFSFFGLTKAMVQRLFGKKDCGCAKRQQWLNRIGYEIQRYLITGLFAISRLFWHLVGKKRQARFRLASEYAALAVRAMFHRERF
jgi:hypothetical protein